MNLERAKLISDVIAIWVGFLALFAGAIFAIVEYNNKIQSDRVKESLHFLDRHQSTLLVASRDIISTAWDKHVQQDRSFWQAKKFDEVGHSKFVIETVEKEELQQHLFKVIEFYAVLDVCVKERICDANTTRKMFQSEAAEYFFRHHSFIEQYRKTTNEMGFASGIESVARSK